MQQHRLVGGLVVGGLVVGGLVVGGLVVGSLVVGSLVVGSLVVGSLVVGSLDVRAVLSTVLWFGPGVLSCSPGFAAICAVLHGREWQKP